MSILFLPIVESNFISGTSNGGSGDVIKISFSSLFLSPGTELRIPTDLGSILFEYNKLNSF